MMLRRLLVLAALVPALAAAKPGARKVVFVNSYHPGYEWSDGEEAGARQVLQARGVELKVIHLDTKRNPDEKFGVAAGLKAKAVIDAERPDAVIVADDPAVKLVLAAHYRNAPLPFVFCGVNWDASPYGLPYGNATGMVEVNLTKELVAALRPYAKGDRIGFLAGDSDTPRTDVAAYRKLGLTFAAERFVKTFAEWKAAYASLQDQVDILIVGVYAGVKDWNQAEATEWALAHARIPAGTVQDYMMPYVDLGMTKVALEQGAWAANTVLAILAGAPPSSIPIAQNKGAELLLNVKRSSKVGIVFKPEILRNAKVL